MSIDVNHRQMMSTSVMLG